MHPAQLLGVALLVVTAQIAVVLLTISGLVHPIATWLSSPQPPQSLSTPFTDSSHIQEMWAAPACRDARPLTPAPDATIAAAPPTPTLRAVARLAASPTCFINLPTLLCCGSRAPPV